jgi:hypothetical protein
MSQSVVIYNEASRSPKIVANPRLLTALRSARDGFPAGSIARLSNDFSVAVVRKRYHYLQGVSWIVPECSSVLSEIIQNSILIEIFGERERT